jgi:hypothetical protein
MQREEARHTASTTGSASLSISITVAAALLPTSRNCSGEERSWSLVDWERRLLERQRDGAT